MRIETFLSTMVPLNNSELDFLRPLIKMETITKGTFYLRNSQISNKVSFIIDGLFKMSVEDSAGNEKIIEFLEPYQFVTDYVSFLNQKATDCDIVALRTSVLESISFANLQKLYDHSSNFQKIGRLLAEQNFIRFAERIKSQSIPPLERYRLLSKNSKLIMDVPQYMIASYLGVSAEWLSKIRSKK